MTTALAALTGASTRPAAANADRGPFIALADGSQWFPLDPRPTDLRSWEPIAVALSREPRFAGHQMPGLDPVLSVAQHCCHVADSLPAVSDGPFPSALRLMGLLHDAPEGLGLRDLPKSLRDAMKRVTAGGGDTPEVSLHRMWVNTFETPCIEAIHRAAGLPAQPHQALTDRVRQADLVALSTEIRDLMPEPLGNWQWDPRLPAPRRDLAIHPWTPAKAAMEFLERLRAWLPDHAPLQA